MFNQFCASNNRLFNEFTVTTSGRDFFANPSAEILVDYLNHDRFIKPVTQELLAKRLFCYGLMRVFQDSESNFLLSNQLARDSTEEEFTKAYRQDAKKFLLQYFADKEASEIVRRISLCESMRYTLAAALWDFFQCD
jgi:hypothetical protein